MWKLLTSPETIGTSEELNDRTKSYLKVQLTFVAQVTFHDLVRNSFGVTMGILPIVLVELVELLKRLGC